MSPSESNSSNDNSRHATWLETDRPAAVEEDYGEPSSNDSGGTMKDPENWRVNLPTDDLDQLMWGSTGVPPPAAPPAPPKYQKDWASPKNENQVEAGDGGTVNADDASEGGEADVNEAQQHHENDNILSALEISIKDQQPPPPVPDKIILEDIVWKQRSGFGKYSFGIIQHEWEQRRVVLFESGILRYYSMKKDMEGVKYDPPHATNPDKSPWVYDDNQEPRGEMDLKVRESPDDENSDNGDDSGGLSPSASFGEGVRRLSSLVPTSEKRPNVGGVTVQARDRYGDPGPTPFEIDIVRRDNHEKWRFCFQSQSIQIEWLSILKSVASNGEDGGDDNIIVQSEGLANHGFQPGDHIIRWEMLPVLYPIQIHGIVLEAGKNCVIIADFGLASYDNRRLAGHEELTTWSEDEGKDDSHDVIMAAWEHIKPKEKKRLNIIVVTDPKDIRKWSKIKYGDQVEKDKKKPGGFFTSFLPGKSPKNVEKDGEEKNETEDDCEESERADADEVTSTAEADGKPVQDIEYANNEQYDAVEANEGEPDWFRPGYKPRKRTSSSSSAIPLNDDGQAVFSINGPDDHPKSELPKSDSAKLVLARTHFILENEDLLPPYHVFYSNSECIAVWCKTGRWSTLQAAVYLVSSSVGFGKSATMLTLSVAAAHLILVPALAVGGLAVIGAPLLFLKKSQEMWDKATMHLTEKFWVHAEPEVFVEAIEYWAQWGKS